MNSVYSTVSGNWHSPLRKMIFVNKRIQISSHNNSNIWIFKWAKLWEGISYKWMHMDLQAFSLEWLNELSSSAKRVTSYHEAKWNNVCEPWELITNSSRWNRIFKIYNIYILIYRGVELIRGYRTICFYNHLLWTTVLFYLCIFLGFLSPWMKKINNSLQLRAKGPTLTEQTLSWELKYKLDDGKHKPYKWLHVSRTRKIIPGEWKHF